MWEAPNCCPHFARGPRRAPAQSRPSCLPARAHGYSAARPLCRPGTAAKLTTSAKSRRRTPACPPGATRRGKPARHNLRSAHRGPGLAAAALASLVGMVAGGGQRARAAARPAVKGRDERQRAASGRRRQPSDGMRPAGAARPSSGADPCKLRPGSLGRATTGARSCTYCGRKGGCGMGNPRGDARACARCRLQRGRPLAGRWPPPGTRRCQPPATRRWSQAARRPPRARAPPRAHVPG
jgi:hypothetical protein